MNFIKKMCILRQLKNGFSGDGKTLSGLVKAEQYGKNLSVEISVINFAPLSTGEYCCVIADPSNRTELLLMRGKYTFNLVTELDISEGFCAVICVTKDSLIPIAYGVNGTKTYSFTSLMKGLAYKEDLIETETANAETVTKVDEQSETTEQEPPKAEEKKYNDELVSDINYYDNGEENERICEEETLAYANTPSGTQSESEKAWQDASKNDDAESLLHTPEFGETDYYKSVRQEIETLFNTYPQDTTLENAFPYSRWAKVSENGKEYLVGVIYEETTPKYVTYALPTKNRLSPPSEIKDVCVFVPKDPFFSEEGYFVIFQSTKTGECVKPDKM